MGAKSYRDLRIFVEANALEIEVHRLTLQLPKNELYELGSQTRRSMNSVRANIVEGYGRRAYKKEFVRFLVYSHASLLETISHLETIDQLYHPKGINLTTRQQLRAAKRTTRQPLPFANLFATISKSALNHLSALRRPRGFAPLTPMVSPGWTDKSK